MNNEYWRAAASCAARRYRFFAPMIHLHASEWHTASPRRPPLVTQPSVMFKRGAFDMGVTVCPIAIKYNKIFVDAFWNRRGRSALGS